MTTAAADTENTHTQAKYWCLTVQSDRATEALWPTLTPSDPFPIEIPDGCVYAVCQVERAPQTGKLHLQLYLAFEKNKRFGAIKRLFPHSHIEKAKGDADDNTKYCTKEDTRVAGPWTFGECPKSKGKKGSRTDWTQVKEMIAQGKSRTEVYETAPHLANCSRGVEVLYQHFAPKVPISRNVRVIVLYGQTGTGKSHRARTGYPDAYVVTGEYAPGKSFDLYCGQDVLILDEWRWAEWPLTMMNAILDKWSLILQCRYQNRQAAWTLVIICTNDTPSLAYNCDPTFQRRILDRTINCIDIENPIVDLTTF